MATLSVPIRAIGVGDLEQVAHEPAQPGRVQLPGRLDQDRFGLHRDLVGEVVGAVSDHLGVSDRQLPVADGLGGFGQRSPEQGPGGPHRAGRGADTHPQAVAEPGRGRPDLLF
jgi:hypothetical protein